MRKCWGFRGLRDPAFYYKNATFIEMLIFYEIMHIIELKNGKMNRKYEKGLRMIIYEFTGFHKLPINGRILSINKQSEAVTWNKRKKYLFHIKMTERAIILQQEFVRI